MKKRLLLLGVCMALSIDRAGATDAIYQNFGTVTNIPQVDAVAFANYGEFDVFTTLPYDTQHTLNFTNTGTMNGNPGFEFDYVVPELGNEFPAANFYNAPGASINAGSFGFGGIIINAGGGLVLGLETPKLLISATNVVNEGLLTSVAGGLVRINGQNVNLRRSVLGLQPFTGGSTLVTPTNFYPDQGISDIYWGMNSDGTPRLRVGPVASAVGTNGLFTSSSGGHRVTNDLAQGFGFGANVSLSTNSKAFVYTNAVTETNWIVQGVFVDIADTNFTVDARFSPSSIPTNLFQTATLEITTQETNVLTGSTFPNSIYILDQIASETNFFALTNLLTGTTARPSTYEITRQAPFQFIGGSPSNAPFNADLFHPGTLKGSNVVASLASNVVTNEYAGYQFNVSYLADVQPGVPGASTTNLSSRIEINAADLNLERTRIRADGAVVINATNINSSEKTVVDVQNISYNIGSTNAPLRFKYLLKGSVDRVAGSISLFSAVWTNQIGTLVTNQIPDPNDPTVMTNEVTTNIIEIGYHVLLADARGLRSKQPVFVSDLRIHSADVLLGDIVRVRNSYLNEAESMTIDTNGQLNLPDSMTGENAPRMKIFTNNGVVNVPNRVNMGMDRDTPYFSIVNNGFWQAFNYRIRTLSFVDRGTMEASSGFGTPGAGSTFHLEAKSAAFDGGTLVAGGDVSLAANDLALLNGATITNQQEIILAITNSIADGGPGTTATIGGRSMTLLFKPKSGDLLDTTVGLAAPQFQVSNIRWAGEDRGASTAGYSDNAAIGHLVLVGGFDTLHSFSPISGQNALYVDYLEFTGSLTNGVEDGMEINPGLVIYFAASNLPAEQLDGLFGGRLQWVPEFVGTAGAVDVTLKSGEVVSMNASIRNSAVIDSDGDGIVNADDEFPLDPDETNPAGDTGTVNPGAMALLSLERNSPQTLSFSFQAAPLGVYVVEMTSNLSSPDWQTVAGYTNVTETTQVATINQPISGGGERFFRVRRVE